MKKEKYKASSISIIKLLVVIVLLIFFIEALIMLSIEYIYKLPNSWQLIVDPLLLSLMISPFIYIMIYNPLKKQILQVKISNEALIHSLNEIACYKFALDQSTIVAITDQRGLITEVNDNFCKISKYSRNELLGQDHRILNSSFHSKEFMRDLWVTIANGKVWKGEIKNKAKDGTYYWMLTSIVPFLNEQGKPYQYLAIRSDITEQKKAEEEQLNYKNELEQKVKERTAELSIVLEYLKVEKNRLAQAQRIAKIGSWEIDFNTGKVFWSDEMYVIFNCNRETYIPDTDSLVSLIHPEDRGLMVQSISEAMLGKEQVPILFRLNTDEINTKYIQGQGEIVFDEKGKSIKARGTMQDITERVRVENALSKSQQRYKYLLDNMNDGFMVDDVEGKAVFVNKKLIEILGLDEEDVSNLMLEEYVLPEYRKIFRKRHNQRLAGEKVVDDFEYEGLRKDGEKIWMGIRVSPVIEKGIVIGTQSVIRDISLRKESEIQLKKTITELGNRYNELMQFNYIVSHNLRAPIANIIGLTNVIGLPNTSIKEKNNIILLIRSATLKMDELLKDLSKILASHSTLNVKREKVYILDVIQSVFDVLNKQIKDSGVDIKVDMADDANEIFTIKSYMESILYNLISNAIKYKSSRRHPKIDVLIKKGRNDKITLRVSDNGRGIDLNKYGKYIFGLYKRFHFDIEGKGLGLHMTKAQIETLGGEIKIESVPDKGTIFTVILPISQIE